MHVTAETPWTHGPTNRSLSHHYIYVDILTKGAFIVVNLTVMVTYTMFVTRYLLLTERQRIGAWNIQIAFVVQCTVLYYFPLSPYTNLPNKNETKYAVFQSGGLVKIRLVHAHFRVEYVIRHFLLMPLFSVCSK
jgi:hypothetical protein